MTPPPRITVLIGTWNNAPTLRRAIDSILAQTVADLELIVVDDGSTDESPDIARSYDDPRVRHLPLEHMGISRSLNAGIEAASSDVVAIQDADDWSLPQRLERQLAVFDSDPRVAVVGCRMKEVDEQGRELATRLPYAAGDVRRALMRFNPIPGTSAAFRKKLALAAGGFDPRFRYAQDYDLWQRLADRHVVVNLGEVLAVRELGMQNAGARWERAQIRETLRVRAEALARRRTLRGATGLVRPTVSLLTPLPLKRAVRRARGQAP